MAARSAGLCLWRFVNGALQVLIVHPGGPFWSKKDNGAWSLPKGEYDPATEDGALAARREFNEEVGQAAPGGDMTPLGETKLKSGKLIQGWAVRGDLDADAIVSNTFEMEWPPRSGRRQAFPEVDRALWCDVSTAAHKLNPAQVVFINRLAELHADSPDHHN
jgi:predicted NUDIX family NTP pyrophosphohydrolase